MAEQQWMSLRAYARHRGVALSAVQKAIETRRVTAIREEGGRITGIERVQADAQWAANTDAVEAARNGKFADAAPTQILAPSPSPPEKPAEATGDQGNFLAARVKEAELRGELLELDKLERLGALVPASLMQSEAMEIFAQAMNAVSRIPDRKAQALAGETDPVRVHRMLSDEIRKVRDEFSSRVAGLAGHAGVEGEVQTAPL